MKVEYPKQCAMLGQLPQETFGLLRLIPMQSGRQNSYDSFWSQCLCLQHLKTNENICDHCLATTMQLRCKLQQLHFEFQCTSTVKSLGQRIFLQRLRSSVFFFGMNLCWQLSCDLIRLTVLVSQVPMMQHFRLVVLAADFSCPTLRTFLLSQQQDSSWDRKQEVGSKVGGMGSLGGVFLSSGWWRQPEIFPNTYIERIVWIPVSYINGASILRGPKLTLNSAQFNEWTADYNS